MKKITLLFLLISSTIFAQAPTGAAGTPEAREAGDVISLFTQTTDASTNVYSDITVSNFNPNWGSTSGNVTIEAQGGDRALKYPAFNYQGVIIGSNINLTAMTTMHVDIWTNDVAPEVFLISASTGEKKINVSANAGSWTSVEVPLTDFSSQGLSLADIKELKFAGGNSSTDIYIDNIYFSRPPADPTTDATLSDIKVDGTSITSFASATETYSLTVPDGTTVVPTVTVVTTETSANAVITAAAGIPGSTTIVVTAGDGSTTKTYTVAFAADPAPTTAPTAPATRNARDVISIYGEAYGTEVGLNGVTWDNGSDGVEVTVAGNKLLKVSNGSGDFVGFDIGNAAGFVNATEMTDFHFDLWIGGDYVAGQVFNTNLSNHAGEIGTQTSAAPINKATAPSDAESWISIDGSLGANPRERIAQIVMNYANSEGAAGAPKVLYLDNIYFYRAATLSTSNNELLNVSMYPNPTSSTLNISAKSTITNAAIYNVLGKQVMSLNINKNSESIDVSNLASGIYLIKYTIENATGNAKFIKK